MWIVTMTKRKAVIWVLLGALAAIALILLSGALHREEGLPIPQQIETNEQRVAYLECGGTMSCQNLVTAIRKALGVHCTVKSTYDQIVAIREFFNRNKGWLLIIDEADKMMSRASLKKMEALREIFDQSEVGLVLSGEPELANRVIMQLPRLASRVEISTELSGLSAREVESYFKGYEIDKDALELLKRRATNRHAGSFRVLDRTLNNLFRRMNESGETRITAALVEEAAQTTLL